MAATGKLSISTQYTLTTTSNTAGTAQDKVAEDYSVSNTTSGTGANQIDVAWSKEATLTATSVTFDLTNLTGPTGTISMAEWTEITIFNDATTASNTLVVGGATNALVGMFADVTDKINILAGGHFSIGCSLLANAYAVTNSTADELKLETAGTVPYRIVIKGRSA